MDISAEVLSICASYREAVKAKNTLTHHYIISQVASIGSVGLSCWMYSREAQGLPFLTLCDAGQ